MNSLKFYVESIFTKYINERHLVRVFIQMEKYSSQTVAVVVTKYCMKT